MRKADFVNYVAEGVEEVLASDGFRNLIYEIVEDALIRRNIPLTESNHTYQQPNPYTPPPYTRPGNPYLPQQPSPYVPQQVPQTNPYVPQQVPQTNPYVPQQVPQAPQINTKVLPKELKEKVEANAMTTNLSAKLNQVGVKIKPGELKNFGPGNI